jgi:hypothetical protein
MFLRALEIKNYRSLEDVSLPSLSNFNVLVGRNNSGKSSVFGALAFLHSIIHGIGVNWTTTFTALDATRSLEIRLLCETRPKDRARLIEIIGLNMEEQRRVAMQNSPLFRRVEFCFVSLPEAGGAFQLKELKILAEDGIWATILSLRGASSPSYNIINFQAAVQPGMLFESDALNGHLLRSPLEFNIDRAYMPNIPPDINEPTRWLMRRLGQYLNQSFFFSPFRHSMERMTVQQTEKLAQNGADLAQVLHTINSNDRPKFSEIESFIHAALPDIGVLQTPLSANNTEVSFSAVDGGYPIRLHDMGGGIEQLLMTITVLLTTGEECSLFLEEPESHLHAGAQRFLIERLQQENRQVFITTHSPTFINTPRSKSLYQVKLTKNRTTITHFNEEDSLSEVLEDIGSRNSDVLLSDAVLFVEGNSDAGAFSAWGETLGRSFAESNITVLPMDGGEDSGRKVRVRGDVLEGISRRAPVPHLFILDHDERSKAEVKKVQGVLGERVHLLHRRELENYILIPRVLLAAIRDKHKDNDVIIEKVDAASVEEIERLIQVTAEGLKGMVLLKRIRAELGGLKEGLLPRELVGTLLPKVNDADFPQLLREAIESRISRHLDGLNLGELVSAERETLEKEWSDPERHLWLAPGEEIISVVFHHFGSEYRKPKDAVRIAREMAVDEIAQEVVDVIKRIASMTNRWGDL